jgi:hypothetical protein
MPDFNVRGDSVNVEQIMEQIRARIREKRGVDYTEDQIRELAAVKLEKFLDPRSIRSDLLEQFRQSQQPPAVMPLYPFEDTTLFDSHRGIIRFLRRLFRPLLKLFFNSNALAQSLHQQTIINQQVLDRLEALRQRGDLYYELLHNLVLELTRATIEVKNMSMRVESIASRLEFNERRARALESVVVYKAADAGREARPTAAAPAAAPPPRGGAFTPRESPRQAPQQPPAQRTQPPASPAPSPSPAAAGSAATPAAASDASPSGEAPVTGEGPGQRSRRRRRRRGRRGGASAVSIMGAAGVPAGEPSPEPSPTDLSLPSPDVRSHESRKAEPAPNAAASGGQTADTAPPEEPRELEPLRPASPAEPSASEPHAQSVDHDDDL